MQTKYCLSLDLDWAPDYIVEEIIELLLQYKVKSTFFVTNDLKVFRNIDKKVFDLGMHPNFYQNSNQGKNIDDIAGYLLDIVPEAKVFRTHGFFQNGLILSDFRKKSGVDIDSSIFLPEIDYIQHVNHLTPHGILKRVPVYWADDYELMKKYLTPNTFNNIEGPGLKVFNFHPIHIYLNTPTYKFYENQKSNIKSHELEVYNGFGIKNIFLNVLKFLSKKETFFIKEIF